jgi:Asp/Glu/hydantoin racemase
MYNNHFLWIFINIFASLLIIYICHSIWIYVIDTYSTKKTKDIVNTHVNKYKQMISELQENKTTQDFVNQSISKNELESMDNLLTDFMQNEM